MIITRGRVTITLIVVGLGALIISQFLIISRLRDENRAISERVAQLTQPRVDSDQVVKPSPTTIHFAPDGNFGPFEAEHTAFAGPVGP